MSRRRFFRFSFGRKQLAEDVRTELEHHIALTEESLVQGGMTPADARAEAARRFGDRSVVESDCLQVGEQLRIRQERSISWIDLRQDLGYAVRSLRRDRAFSLTATIIMGIGIGATTALFSLYRGTVLRPLNAKDPGKLLLIEIADANGRGDNVTPAAWFEWKERARTLVGLAWVGPGSATLEANGAPEQIDGFSLSQETLSVLGIRPALGRAFDDSDFEGVGQDVVLISDRLWRRRFNADPHLPGHTILLDGRSESIVGVMPADLDVFGTPLDYWLPKPLPLSQRANKSTRYLAAVGRLAPDVSIETARQELQALLQPTLPPGDIGAAGWRVRLTPLGDVYSAPFRDRLLLLLGAGLAVLLIGCANIGNLLLARGTARRQELALRAALGASRGRLVRQLLTENLVLGVVAGGLGLLIGHWVLQGLLSLLPTDIPRLSTVRLDWQAVAVAIGLAVVVALVVGLVPALRAARIDLRGVLGEGGRGAGHHAPGNGLRRGLIVAEVALSTVLLISAGLLVHSATMLSRVPPGFVTDSVLTAAVALPERTYHTGQLVKLAYQRLLLSLQSASGPHAVAMISQVPLGQGGFGTRFHQIDHPMVGTDGVLSNIRISTEGYFGVMGMGLIAGRDFNSADEPGAQPVVLVNETFARVMGWSGPPVGQLVRTENKDIGSREGQTTNFEVIGVVKDVQEWGLREPPSPMLYLPLAQAPDAPWDWIGRQMLIVARGPADAMALVPMLKTAIRSVDPGLPLYGIQTMGQRLRESLAAERTNTIVITSLGLIALVLAAAGIYGVLAYGVRQRTGEIGIRMALGAANGDIIRLIMGEGMRLTIIGLLIGLPAAYGASRLLQNSLFGVAPTDLASFAGSGLVLFLATALACLIPVRLALAVPPADALRG